MSNDGSNNKNIVNDTNIRLAVSDVSLADRIKVRLTDPDTDVYIYWYIKFNVELDETSVSNKSMIVTELNGYILDTEMYYDIAKNLIVIKPVDPYEEGIFYILTITRKVRSKGGNSLKRDIYILFKIKDNRIEEYKILPSGTIVEKPRKKPEKLKRETAARAYTQEAAKKIEKAPAATLPYGKMGINVVAVVLALPITILGLVMGYAPMVYIGTGLILLGIIHMAAQVNNKKKRSALVYNVGVIFFNVGAYKAAAKRLSRAARLDPHNELAEYGASKIKFYL